MRILKMIYLIYQAKVNPKVNPKKGKKTTSFYFSPPKRPVFIYLIRKNARQVFTDRLKKIYTDVSAKEEKDELVEGKVNDTEVAADDPTEEEKDELDEKKVENEGVGQNREVTPESKEVTEEGKISKSDENVEEEENLKSDEEVEEEENPMSDKDVEEEKNPKSDEEVEGENTQNSSELCIDESPNYVDLGKGNINLFSSSLILN